MNHVTCEVFHGLLEREPIRGLACIDAHIRYGGVAGQSVDRRRWKPGTRRKGLSSQGTTTAQVRLPLSGILEDRGPWQFHRVKFEEQVLDPGGSAPLHMKSTKFRR
jgi:hypothetical protein